MNYVEVFLKIFKKKKFAKLKKGHKSDLKKYFTHKLTAKFRYTL